MTAILRVYMTVAFNSDCATDNARDSARQVSEAFLHSAPQRTDAKTIFAKSRGLIYNHCVCTKQGLKHTYT